MVCQALLEHVRDSQAAITAIASILKPGGTALIFLPSRNAVFARIDLLLPQQLRRKILHTVFPRRQTSAVWPPRGGLAVDVWKVYFRSSYFTFFFPLHFAWRIWMLIFRLFKGEQAAEIVLVGASRKI